MSDSVSKYFERKPRTVEGERRYFQNDFILSTAININRAVEQEGLTQKELAQRLGRSEGYVSQVLSGGGNLTLRTLADFAFGLGFVVDVVFRKSAAQAVSEQRPLWRPTEVVRPKDSHRRGTAQAPGQR